MKININHLLILILILLIVSSLSFNKEHFYNSECISSESYNISKNKECNDLIITRKTTDPVKKFNISPSHCLVNKYEQYKTPKIIGNLKISLKCDPSLDCACGDVSSCAYVKDENGNTKLKPVCKVSNQDMNNILNTNVRKMIKYSNNLTKLPSVCDKPDLQKGWYYEPGVNLEKVKQIYIENNLGPQSKCKMPKVPESNIYPKDILPKEKNVSFLLNSNIPRASNSVKLLLNTNRYPNNIIQQEIKPPVQEESLRNEPNLCKGMLSQSTNFNGIITNDNFGFNGNNYISLPANVAPQLANSDLTIEFWANIPSTFNNGYGVLYSQGNGAGLGLFNISFYKSSRQAFTLYCMFFGDKTNKRYIQKFPANYLTNKWNHYAITRNNRSGKLIMYINGINQNLPRKVYPGDPGNKFIASGEANIGIGMNKSGYLKGSFKKLKIFNKVRTLQEIKESSNNDSPTEPCPTDALLYIPMNSTDKNIYYKK